VLFCCNALVALWPKTDIPVALRNVRFQE